MKSLVVLTLLLQVRPEALLAPAGADAVRLKIRLAQGATAQVWTAESCTAPPDSALQITRSGDFQLSLSPQSGQSKVCLASSDGLLNASLPFGQ